MARREEFADPVVVPGPNIRSLFTDTESVEDSAVELVDDQARTCPACERLYPLTALVCVDDGAALVDPAAT